MFADEEFGRLVGDRLREETTDVHTAGDLAAVVRRRQSRRAWTIRASIGAPLVAAAAAVAVLVSTAGGAPAPSGGAQAVGTTTQPRVENLAHVQSMTIEALRSAQEYVIYEKQVLDTGYSEFWTDRATQRYRMDTYSTLVQPARQTRSDGTVTVPEGPGGVPTGPLHLTTSVAGDGPLIDRQYVTVDHERHTWSAFHDSMDAPPSEVPDVLDADALKQAIDQGRLELVGTEPVDGRETHHLRLFATVRGYQIDLWVDRTSYLPVRQTAATLDNPAKTLIDSDYTWLPRSEENLAKLTLTPPPGFTKE